jgi:predicted DNA-binding transcriptional regulator AlpA
MPDKASETRPEFQYISPREAAAIAGTSIPTVVRWSRTGIFPKRRRLGLRKTGFLLSEVQEWVRTRKAVA